MHVYSPESIRLMSHSCRTDRTKVTPCLVSVLSNTLIRGFVYLVMTLPLGSVHMMEGTGSPLLIQVRSTDWPGSIPMFPDDTTILTGTVVDQASLLHIKQTNKQTKQQQQKTINKQKTQTNKETKQRLQNKHHCYISRKQTNKTTKQQKTTTINNKQKNTKTRKQNEDKNLP